MIEFLTRAGPPCLFAFAGAFAAASLWNDFRALRAQFKEMNRDLSDQ